VAPTWLSHDERARGTLLPGKLADLIVLDRDPYAIPVDELPEVQVVARWSAAAGCTTRHPGINQRLLHLHRRFDQIAPSPRKESEMEAGARSFNHLREHSIGLPQVLFQSITHMAPAAAIAYSIYISSRTRGRRCRSRSGLALIACVCAATAIGQLGESSSRAPAGSKHVRSPLARAVGRLPHGVPLHRLPAARRALPLLEFGWAMHDVFNTSVGWHWSGQWVVWVLLMAAIVFMLTYRDVRISTTAGVILGAFEIAIFATLAIWILFSKSSDLNLQPFNPNHAVGHWSGVFKGVFAILAFIGFERRRHSGKRRRTRDVRCHAP